jgi:hypothetical protein
MMKHMKILGIAAVAAMALMAFAASSASATTILNGSNVRLEAGSKISASLASGTSANLTTTEGTTLDTCTTSEIEGEVTNAGGGSGVNVVGKLTKLHWTGCTEPTSSVDLDETAGVNFGKLEIAWTKETNGTVTGKESIVKVNTTIFGAVCEYTTGEGTDLGELKGATGEAKATLAINAVIKAKNSFFCPDARWQATYTVTSPLGLHAEKE